MLLDVAQVIREDFLQQNAFSKYDFTCPLHKSVAMLRSIVLFHDLAQKAILESPPDNKLTWNHIRVFMKKFKPEVGILFYFLIIISYFIYMSWGSYTSHHN